MQNDFLAALRRKYQLQVKLAWPKEESLITDYLWGRKTERSPIFDLIEIGAGYGDLSPHLERLFLTHLAKAKHYLVERNPDCWKALESRWSTRVDIRFFKGDWLDCPNPDTGVDFILARLVLHEEGNNAPEFLSKCFRVLRPGGVMAVVDIDDACWGCGMPEAEELERLQQELSYLSGVFGQDRYIGRKLPQLFSTAGFGEIEFGSVTLHSDVDGREDMVALARPVVSAGMLKEFADRTDTAPVVQVFHDLELWCAQPDASFMIQNFVCLGAKAE